MSESVLRDKSKEYAKKIIKLCRELKNEKKEAVLINQLLRCSTSIGANVYEAQYAQEPKDFISKFEISLKECHESEYWLELLYETECIDEAVYKPLKNDCGAIRRMLVSSLNTIKENNQNNL